MRLGVHERGHAKKRLLEYMITWGSEGDSHDHKVSFLVVSFSSKSFIGTFWADSLSYVVPQWEEAPYEICGLSAGWLTDLIKLNQ